MWVTDLDVMLINVVIDIQSLSNKTCSLANALLHNPRPLGNMRNELEPRIPVPIIAMDEVLQQREVRQRLRYHVVQRQRVLRRSRNLLNPNDNHQLDSFHGWTDQATTNCNNNVSLISPNNWIIKS